MFTLLLHCGQAALSTLKQAAASTSDKSREDSQHLMQRQAELTQVRFS
jgi:hypothetical protein